MKTKKLYEELSIPSLSIQRTHQMLIYYHDKCVVMKKNQKRANLYASVNAGISQFIDIAQKNLFDICVCKCPNFDLCSCLPENRVPVQIRNFLTDQRTIREMKISSAFSDTAYTNRQSSLHEIQHFDDCVEHIEEHIYGLRSTAKDQSEEISETTNNESVTQKPCTQNRTKLTNTVLASQRYKINPRATAALTTAVLR